MNIYQENILDHYEHPRNWGKIQEPDATGHDSNPLCGDVFDMDLKVDKKKILDAKFEGHGCAISTASASMLTEKIKGMDLADIVKMDNKDILNLLGIELSHVRIKCALLPLKVIKLAVYDYLDKNK